MKTIKQAKQDAYCDALKNLITPVINQLGDYKQLEGLRSADAGYSGFIYYSDTHEFAMRNRKKIVALLNETAESFGEEVVSMVKNFGVFKGKMDNYELQDLYKYLGGGRPEQGQVTNVMAWFALEEVANLFND